MTAQAQERWAQPEIAAVLARPRVRGLRMPALPSWPLVAQVAGAVSALWGVDHQWGAGVAAIVGGVAAVLVGALREAGKI